MRAASGCRKVLAAMMIAAPATASRHIHAPASAPTAAVSHREAAVLSPVTDTQSYGSELDPESLCSYPPEPDPESLCSCPPEPDPESLRSCPPNMNPRRNRVMRRRYSGWLTCKM
jgi:hypothetical protein